MLFFDKILSGNLNISCASCHHPMTGTGDGLALSVGEGGRGLGATRDTGYAEDAVHERVPRNAPPLFNLGAREFVRLFLDGRVEEDPTAPSGFSTPAGDDLPDGLDNALAAQAMFPVTSAAEMAGQAGENEQADAAAQNRLAGPGGVWDLIAQKLRAVPAYTDLFVAAFPDEVAQAEDITFVHAVNAIAAYEASAWRSDNSPFDRFLVLPWSIWPAMPRMTWGRGAAVMDRSSRAGCRWARGRSRRTHPRPVQGLRPRSCAQLGL